MTSNDARAVPIERRLYADYETWKGWTRPFTYDEDAADYFARESAGLRIRDVDLLELGFGSGSFLAWARESGARTCGTEMIPALLAAAEEAGVEVLPAEIETVASRHRERFDTVVAFDVFEHFSLEQIVTRLAAVELMLKPGGQLLLRFPNAQSPFGLAPQFGDPTHRTALSRGVFEQLIQGSSWVVVRYGGSARASGRTVSKRVVRFLRHLLQDWIAFALNAIYAQAIPWDSVVVLVLRKGEVAGGSVRGNEC